MLNNAVLAGIWASLGSHIAKLTGSKVIVGDSYIIFGVLVAIMVVFNSLGCRHFLRALDECDNAVVPTVISAASSFVLSGLFGVLFYEESTPVLWWVGAVLILIGMNLVTRSQNKNKTD